MTEKILIKKHILRNKRKLKTRSKIFGTESKPRISIFRSNKYLYAQAINDTKGITIVCVDGKKMGLGNNKEQSKQIATEFAKNLKQNNITQAVFDRNGYLYHGVVAAFADSLRENGIKL